MSDTWWKHFLVSLEIAFTRGNRQCLGMLAASWTKCAHGTSAYEPELMCPCQGLILWPGSVCTWREYFQKYFGAWCCCYTGFAISSDHTTRGIRPSTKSCTIIYQIIYHTSDTNGAGKTNEDLDDLLRLLGSVPACVVDQLQPLVSGTGSVW